MGIKPVAVVGILTISILLAGCLSEYKKSETKGIIFEIKPANITVKDNESAQVKIYVNNTGKSTIHPVVRFNLNPGDRPYVDFIPESYDLGSLRPGEDSGSRIVDIKARTAAGIEVKYVARAQVINDGAVLESKDIVITVTR